MGVVSFLGKSKTVKGAVLGLSLYLADEALPEFSYEAFAQDNKPKIERLEKEFQPKPSKTVAIGYEWVLDKATVNTEGFVPAGIFPGVRIRVGTLSNRLYRYGGSVWSIPEYLLDARRKLGYRIKVNDNFRDTDPMVKGKSDEEQGIYFLKKHRGDNIGLCFWGTFEKDGKTYVFSVPFYRTISPQVDPFLDAHEDWHSAQDLSCNDCYTELDKRLRRQGYNIVFSDLDEEEQANVAGLSRMIEDELPLDAVFQRCGGAKNAYERMQDRRIPVLSGLYKPGHTKK